MATGLAAGRGGGVASSGLCAAWGGWAGWRLGGAAGCGPGISSGRLFHTWSFSLPMGRETFNGSTPRANLRAPDGALESARSALSVLVCAAAGLPQQQGTESRKESATGNRIVNRRHALSWRSSGEGPCSEASKISPNRSYTILRPLLRSLRQLNFRGTSARARCRKLMEYGPGLDSRGARSLFGK